MRIDLDAVADFCVLLILFAVAVGMVEIGSTYAASHPETWKEAHHAHE